MVLTEEIGEGARKEDPSAVEEVKQREIETKNLPAVLDNIGKAILERTGFATSILMGGIKHDGMLGGTVIHNGKTAEAGLSFKDTMMNYEEAIVDPWSRFLDRAYPLSQCKAQADLYKKAYKLQDAEEDFVRGQACTKIWVYECDDEDNEEGGDGGEPTNKEAGTSGSASSIMVPSAASLSASIEPSIQLGSTTQATAVPATSTASGAVECHVAMTPSGSGSTVLTPVINPDWNIPPSGNNSSGLHLPLPDEISWEPKSDTESMTAGIGSSMTSIDMGFARETGDENLSDISHTALLHQNSMPHRGLDLSYNDAGRNDQDWSWLNFLNNYGPGTFDPINAVTHQTNYNSTMPTPFNFPAMSNSVITFPLGTPNPLALSAISTTAAITSTATAASAAALSKANGITTSKVNNDGAVTMSTATPASISNASTISHASSACTSETPVSALDTGSIPASSVGNGLPSDSVTTTAPTHNSNVPKTLKSSTNSAPDNNSNPLQELSLNTERRSSGRPHKRKLHPDAVFEKEQEAREVKQKKGRGQPKKGKM